MTESRPPSRSTDPWAAFGRVTGGVLVYGAIGFGLDRWWGTSFVVAIGVILGAVLGTYTVFRSQQQQMNA